MAGVIRSKGPQVFSANVRRANTDSGSDEVTGALQRAAQRVNDASYQASQRIHAANTRARNIRDDADFAARKEKDAADFNRQKIEQEQLGRNTAMHMPIRDEATNKIIYQDVTSAMSYVARNAARPIIEKKYAIAFGNDANRVLGEVRAKYTDDVEGFDAASEVALSGLLDAVPEDFREVALSTLESNAADVAIQHRNAIQIKQAAKEQAAAIEDLQIHYADQNNTVEALVLSGDIAGAQALHDATIATIQADGVEQGLTDQFIKDTTDRANNAYYGTMFRNTADILLATGEENKVMAIERALIAGSFNDQGKEIVADLLGMNDDAIQSIDNPALRKQIANELSALRGRYAAGITANAKAVEMKTFGENLAAGLNVLGGSKQADMSDELFANVGIGSTSWGSNQARGILESNPTAMRWLTAGNILPASLKATFEGVADGSASISTDEELQNLLYLANVSLSRVGPRGEKISTKNLSDKAAMFWSNISTFVNSYGSDKIGQGVQFLSNETDMSQRNSSIAQNLKLDTVEPTKVRRSVQARLFDNADNFFGENVPRDAVQRMTNIAMTAYATFDENTAENVIKNSYAAIYSDTEVVRIPNAMGGYKVDKHEFAPEAFYNDEQMDKVKFHVEGMMSGAMPAGYNAKLGDNVFLYPTRTSTNTEVTWQLIDREGQPVIRNNRPLTITSTQLNNQNNFTSDFDAAVAEKVRKAQEARMKMLESGATEDAMVP